MAQMTVTSKAIAADQASCRCRARPEPVGRDRESMSVIMVNGSFRVGRYRLAGTASGSTGLLEAAPAGDWRRVRGIHQLAGPSRDTKAGTSRARMMVASRITPRAMA